MSDERVQISLSEQAAFRLAAAMERLAKALEEQAQEREPVSFPNAPVLPKDRPRAGRRHA